MSDLAKWKVHGPVRFVKTLYAEWDLAQEEWQTPRSHNEATFRSDGKLDENRHFNPDGTIPRTKNLYNKSGLLTETQFWKDESLENQVFYSYDHAGRHVRTVSLNHGGTERETETSTYDSLGRKTTVRFLYPPEGTGHISYWIEGADHGVGAPGAVTMTTVYDASNLPTEVLFNDGHKALVRRVLLTRNEGSNLIKVECLFGDLPPFPEAEAQGGKPGMPVADLLAKVFGPSQALSTTTYAYDENGLLVE